MFERILQRVGLNNHVMNSAKWSNSADGSLPENNNTPPPTNPEEPHERRNPIPSYLAGIGISLASGAITAASEQSRNFSEMVFKGDWNQLVTYAGVTASLGLILLLTNHKRIQNNPLTLGWIASSSGLVASSMRVDTGNHLVDFAAYFATTGILSIMYGLNYIHRNRL